MEGVEQFGYLSQHNRKIDAHEVVSILNASRSRNQRLGITGFLIQGSDWFYQIIEGPLESINYLIPIIQADARHSFLSSARGVAKPERDFPNWRMGHWRVAETRHPESCALLCSDAPFDAKRDKLKSLSISYEVLRAG